MNRGSPDLRIAGRPVVEPSMRPRFMNRGSGTENREETAMRETFNEAPIHESGKYACQRSLQAKQRPFNEAPIHESGKS